MDTLTKETAIELFKSPDILSKFEAVRGKYGANSYVQSALIVIADNPKLLECTPKSLVKSTLRSASLGLSLDPVARQAYLIPRSQKVKATKSAPEHYETVACFQPHYHGLFDLAVRTNKYRTINVSPIHEGERVYLDVSTGLHRFSSGNVLATPNPDITGLHDGYREVTSGKPKSKIIGYLGYFKTNKGFEKTVWMTTEEIHEHAKTWAPDNYNSQYGAWKDEKKRPTMEMKTVFIALSKFMDLSGDEKLQEAIRAELNTDDAIEAETEEIKEAK